MGVRCVEAYEECCGGECGDLWGEVLGGGCRCLCGVVGCGDICVGVMCVCVEACKEW